MVNADAGDAVPVAGRVYRLPAGKIVRRAREWYLYDQDGTRYLDFWQADGAAFLGHRPDGYARLAKAEIDRGLWTAVPTPWPGRLERALAELSVVVRPQAPPRLEPVNGRPAATHPGVTRWLPTGTEPDAGVWQLVLPAPGVELPCGGAYTELSAVHAALLTRAAHNLLTYLSSAAAVDRRVRVAMESACPPGYTRRGAWFVPDAPEVANGGNAGSAGSAGDSAVQLQRWRDIADRALAARIVLPPDPWTPIPVPGEMQRTDQKQWENVCNEWPQ
ncbi:MAG: hypothetical protein PF508_03650 [Spirochaeta sp.]|jgi:hypothetical protein|nr:hypothetical protein [Spirochaeta sp.]